MSQYFHAFSSLFVPFLPALERPVCWRLGPQPVALQRGDEAFWRWGPMAMITLRVCPCPPDHTKHLSLQGSLHPVLYLSPLLLLPGFHEVSVSSATLSCHSVLNHHELKATWLRNEDWNLWTSEPKYVFPFISSVSCIFHCDRKLTWSSLHHSSKLVNSFYQVHHNR